MSTRTDHTLSRTDRRPVLRLSPGGLGATLSLAAPSTGARAMPDASEFARIPLPKRFCNVVRLWHALEVRGLDGIVACQPHNVFYLTGFYPIAHKADEPRPYAVLLSRHAPEHPILVVADYYLASFLGQPTWVEDIRPFRAVMLPLDLPPKRAAIAQIGRAAGEERVGQYG